MTTTLDLPSPGPSGLQLAFGGIVLAIGVAGAMLATTSFLAAAAPKEAQLEAVGEVIPTSYGSMTVEHVATIGGLTPEALGGVTHGIQNLVLTGQAQVEVSVMVVNSGSDRIAVVPDQFTLEVAGVDGPVPMAGSTIKPLRLAAGGSVEATLTYVVPESGAAMTVHYADPGGAVVDVDGGVLGKVAPPADEHTH